MGEIKLSYVRGLRNILEVPTREARRKYIIREERKPWIRAAENVGIASFLGITSFTNLFEVDNSTILMSYLTLGAILVYNNISNFRSVFGHLKLEEGACAHQESLRHGGPVPKRLEMEKFS